MDDDLGAIIIGTIVITLIVLPIGFGIEAFRWNVYKRVAHSDIAFWDFVILGDKIRVVQ